MRTFLALLSLLVATVGPAYSAAIDAKVLFRGTFRNTWDKPAPVEPKINLGLIWGGPVPSVETTSIDGKKGLLFGILFKPSGGKALGSKIKLRYVTHFPAPGIPQPGKGPLLKAESEIDCQIDEVCAAQFSFDSEAEIVPGTWRFEIYDGNRKIVEETLKVQAAKASKGADDSIRKPPPGYLYTNAK